MLYRDDVHLIVLGLEAMLSRWFQEKGGLAPVEVVAGCSDSTPEHSPMQVGSSDGCGQAESYAWPTDGGIDSCSSHSLWSLEPVAVCSRHVRRLNVLVAS